MKLGNYLEQEGLKVKEFAVLADVSEQAIYKYLNGERKPEPEVAERIEHLTKGNVTLYDLTGVKKFEQSNTPVAHPSASNGAYKGGKKGSQALSKNS